MNIIILVNKENQLFKKMKDKLPQECENHLDKVLSSWDLPFSTSQSQKLKRKSIMNVILNLNNVAWSEIATFYVSVQDQEHNSQSFATKFTVY